MHHCCQRESDACLLLGSAVSDVSKHFEVSQIPFVVLINLVIQNLDWLEQKAARMRSVLIGLFVAFELCNVKNE